MIGLALPAAVCIPASQADGTALRHRACNREHAGTEGRSWRQLNWSLSHIAMLLQGALATASSEELPFDASKVGGGERSGEHLESAMMEAPRSRLIQVEQTPLCAPCAQHYLLGYATAPGCRPGAFALFMQADRKEWGVSSNTSPLTACYLAGSDGVAYVTCLHVHSLPLYSAAGSTPPQECICFQPPPQPYAA